MGSVRQQHHYQASGELDGLADLMAEGPASDTYHAALAEFCRRQVESQQAAAMAQTQSARYVFWAMTAGMTGTICVVFLELLERIYPA